MLRWAYGIGRVCVAIFFVVAGVKKFLDAGALSRALADFRLPIPAEVEPYLLGLSRYEALAYLLAAIETICGLMVLAGLKARWAALVLIVFAAGNIAFVHNFWEMSGPLAATHQTLALLNLAVLGALLLIVAGGSHGNRVGGLPA